MKHVKKTLLYLTVFALLCVLGSPPTQVSAAVKAKKVSLDKTVYTMKKGSQIKLKATVTPKKAAKKLVWVSSDTKVASVNKNGKVSAKKKGTAQITVQVKNTKLKAACKITVGTPVKKVLVDQSEVSLEKGQTHEIIATIRPQKSSIGGVTFSSDNTLVAKVGSKGKIRACAAGSAVITVTAKDGSGAKATVHVTVTDSSQGENIPVSDIQLSPASLSLKKGDVSRLTVSVLPENATNKAVVLESSAPGVAAVDADGKVSAVAEGTAVITATASDGSGVKAIASVVVTSESAITPGGGSGGSSSGGSSEEPGKVELESMEVKPNVIDVGVGESLDLGEILQITYDPMDAEISSLHYYIEDEDNMAVSVSSDGILKGLNEGGTDLIVEAVDTSGNTVKSYIWVQVGYAREDKVEELKEYIEIVEDMQTHVVGEENKQAVTDMLDKANTILQDQSAKIYELELQREILRDWIWECEEGTSVTFSGSEIQSYTFGDDERIRDGEEDLYIDCFADGTPDVQITVNDNALLEYDETDDSVIYVTAPNGYRCKYTITYQKADALDILYVDAYMEDEDMVSTYVWGQVSDDNGEFYYLRVSGYTESLPDNFTVSPRGWYSASSEACKVEYGESDKEGYVKTVKVSYGEQSRTYYISYVQDFSQDVDIDAIYCKSKHGVSMIEEEGWETGKGYDSSGKLFYELSVSGYSKNMPETLDVYMRNDQGILQYDAMTMTITESDKDGYNGMGTVTSDQGTRTYYINYEWDEDGGLAIDSIHSSGTSPVKDNFGENNCGLVEDGDSSYYVYELTGFSPSIPDSLEYWTKSDDAQVIESESDIKEYAKKVVVEYSSDMGSECRRTYYLDYIPDSHMAVEIMGIGIKGEGAESSIRNWNTKYDEAGNQVIHIEGTKAQLDYDNLMITPYAYSDNGNGLKIEVSDNPEYEKMATITWTYDSGQEGTTTITETYYIEYICVN